MSIAGVSAASFGFTLFNNLEERGAQILNAKLASDPLYAEVERFLLPGPLYNSSYALTMEHVARYTRDFSDCDVDFARYRRLQILTHLIAGRGWLRPGGAAEALWPRLARREKLWAAVMAAPLLLGRIFGMEKRVGQGLDRLAGLYGFVPEQVILDRGGFSRLIQVYEAIQGGALRPQRGDAA